jgi:hypothetical protein
VRSWAAGADRAAVPLQLIELIREAIDLGPNFGKSVMRDAIERV